MPDSSATFAGEKHAGRLAGWLGDAQQVQSPTRVLPLQKKFGYEKIVMVGDGATDAEARRPGGADIFIGWVDLCSQPLARHL